MLRRPAPLAVVPHRPAPLAVVPHRPAPIALRGAGRSEGLSKKSSLAKEFGSFGELFVQAAVKPQFRALFKLTVKNRLAKHGKTEHFC